VLAVALSAADWAVCSADRALADALLALRLAIISATNATMTPTTAANALTYSVHSGLVAGGTGARVHWPIDGG
jgi:hypothetical protein